MDPIDRRWPVIARIWGLHAVFHIVAGIQTLGLYSVVFPDELTGNGIGTRAVRTYMSTSM